jgi:hypothetical protein
MKNITLSADEQLIDAARERARSEQTTLNEKFRQWLAEYAHEYTHGYTQSQARLQRYDEVMASLRGQLVVGAQLAREQMNER